MLKAVVLCSALFTAPSWYQSLVQHQAAVQPAFARFVIALPVAYVLLLIVKTVASAEPPQAPAADPVRVAHELAAMEQPHVPAQEVQAVPAGQMTTTENSPLP